MRAMRPLTMLSLAVFVTVLPQLNGSAHATFPGANGRIAYAGFADADQEIFVINSDGSGRINITNNSAFDLQPRWSPDGKKIAFASDRSGNMEVYVMNPDGTGVLNLTQHPGDDRSPAWSPDGSKIAFTSTRDGNREIYVMSSANGSGQTNLTNYFVHDDDPDWSPDGTKIAYSFGDIGERDIAVLDVQGIDDSILLTNTSDDESDPSWSPSGAHIAFTKDDDDSKREIYVMGANGSNPTNITNHPDDDLTPVWSPDGLKIAFASDRDEDRDIHVMNADGSGVVNLTLDYDPINSSPDWSISGSVSLELELSPARMTIPDWRGDDEHEFEVDPPRVTKFGRTVVPVTVTLTLNGMPLEGESVTITAAPQGVEEVGASLFGFSGDPGGAGPETIVVETNEDGQAITFFHVDDLYLNGAEGDPHPSGFEITAEHGADSLTEGVPVVDNRAGILADYTTTNSYIQSGARSIWRDAFLPPLRGAWIDLPGAILGAAVQPGNTGKGTILCNKYQSRTLLFLNDIRHSDEGWRLNGLHYTPIQTLHTEHHFVTLYPEEEFYNTSRAIILDPWLAQTAAFYSWTEFVNFVDTLSGGANIQPDVSLNPKNPGTCVVQCGIGNFIPPYYPGSNGPYPWFPENDSLPIEGFGGIPGKYDACLSIPNDWCQRNGFGGNTNKKPVTIEDHPTVVIGSPVTFHVSLSNGDSYGYAADAPATLVNDFAEDGTTAHLVYPKANDDRGWYVEVPPTRTFTLEIPAQGDGEMSLVILGTDGEIWGGYTNVPVEDGLTIELDVDLDEECDDLELPGDDPVACIKSIPGATCGDPNADKTITASDALAALRAAVQLTTCPLAVCDVNDDGNVFASDALAILQRAVGTPRALRCPFPA